MFKPVTLVNLTFIMIYNSFLQYPQHWSITNSQGKYEILKDNWQVDMHVITLINYQPWILPIPTRVPTVYSEKSIFHSSKGSKDLLRILDKSSTLLHLEIISSSSPTKYDGPRYRKARPPWGDEGKDMAFSELYCILRRI